MPTMRPPKRGVSFSEAITRAYATAPVTEVLINTLEFRHPVIVDADGNPTGRRIVNAHESVMATLEDTAPLNPGETVLFESCFFGIKKQSESDAGKMAQLTIVVANVNHLLMPYLEAQKASRTQVEVTYRPYLASDLSGPHYDPPITLTCTTFTADTRVCTITAGFSKLTNRRWPSVEYTAKNVPGLTAR